MAAGGDNGNLVQDFEEAFQVTGFGFMKYFIRRYEIVYMDLFLQKCISALTEEDDLNERDSESESKNIESKITQFTDLARNLETFFLSKRFLIYNHKPEFILREVRISNEIFFYPN